MEWSDVRVGQKSKAGVNPIKEIESRKVYISLKFRDSALIEIHHNNEAFKLK
jgi:hypothetical protein